jgi:nucleoside-diphosphate-sugar epimerase
MDKMAITGGAGFIGSNLAENLLARDFSIVIIDNLSTGKEENLAGWSERAGSRFEFIRSDINQTDLLRRAFKGAAYVFHLAAIPSVARSIEDPEATQAANITGTLSVLTAARDAGVKRVISASSSAIYGDDPNLPKKEDCIGRCLSPYALSKYVTEEYGRLFYQLYGLEAVSLRYFNVFGPRQDPNSDYAAVIPRFSTRLLSGRPPIVYGDGEQTRDFTYVSNVVDANWKAATCPQIAGEAFNIGCGIRTSLNQLIEKMNDILGSRIEPTYEPGRQGDVRHSLADVGKAERMMGFSSATSLEAGLRHVLSWYRGR